MASVDARLRLLELAGARNASLASLSGLIGRNSTYLQQFVRKGSPRRLEERDRRTLARFFGVDEAELGAPEDLSHSPAEFVAIPRLPLSAAAGAGALTADEAPVGAFGVTPRWLREHGLDPRKLSAIRVEGDSMDPLLRDGDEILVDTTPRPLRDGIHVVRVGDNLMVKRLDTGQPGMVALHSDNSAYRRVELPRDEVTVIGRVVWKSGRL